LGVGDWVSLHSLRAAKVAENGSKWATIRLRTKLRDEAKTRQKRGNKDAKRETKKVNENAKNSCLKI
jgi:hypothetical protein